MRFPLHACVIARGLVVCAKPGALMQRWAPGSMLALQAMEAFASVLLCSEYLHCPKRKQLPTTESCASRGNRHLPLDLLQDHVVCGKVGRFAEVATAKVLLIRVTQTINEAELWPPVQLSFRLSACPQVRRLTSITCTQSADSLPDLPDTCTLTGAMPGYYAARSALQLWTEARN